jgi:hypothetical protein
MTDCSQAANRERVALSIRFDDGLRRFALLTNATVDSPSILYEHSMV